ncbi:MAG: endonuclease/exonuclease/phosphatase family protein [Candidatus Polarisedimenticolaceae bacterium]|nr:endonuclease/exonuclease/phosphatase family protein [Candidatus Polarisedimenticolaceae bacterium]
MQGVTTDEITDGATGTKNRLRLLTYNIQSGIDTKRYREYLTKGWRQLLPHRERQLNLNRIANMLHQYDVVGLQEVDSGSLRSGFIDQTEYLAHRAGFPYWYKQVNRSLGKFAQHSNGVLSKIQPSWVSEYKLPGFPGRGAMVIEYEASTEKLAICVLHLALSRRARTRQLAYLSELVGHYQHLIVMGDFNCGGDAREFQALADNTGLKRPSHELKSFPSWRPSRMLDHILASPSLIMEHAQVLNYPHSDHLPVSVDILLPDSLHFAL